MNWLMLCCWIACGTYAFAVNRDPVSPSKYLLSTLAIYFGVIFVDSEQPMQVFGCFFGLLVLATFLAVVERESFRSAITIWPWRSRLLRTQRWIPVGNRRLGAERPAQTRLPVPAEGPPPSPWRTAALVWAATCIPLGVYVWLFARFGGAEAFFDSGKNRVLEWQGLGPILIFATITPALNLFYFVSVLTARRLTYSYLAVYLLHFAVTVILSIGTSSRSQMLNVIAVSIVLFHYLYRRISAVRFGIVVATLVTLAAFLGAAREVSKYEQGEFKLNLDKMEDSFRLSLFSYGTVPLGVLAKADIITPLMGTTFLSIFTNPVPRVFWPDKPETGGIRFTKLYMDNQWDGTSYATPGLIGESIMNFGWYVGVPFAFSAFFWLFIKIERYYSRFVASVLPQNPDFWNGIRLLLYIYALQYCCALLVGEFTNTTIPTLFNCCWIFFLRKIVRMHGIA
jgi:hypothetical protein